MPLGLVMVYSSSFVDAFTNHDNQLYYTWRQLGGAIIGTAGLLVAQRLDYRFWRTYSVQLLAATLLLLLIVLVLPASITEVNGARQWIRLGPFSMQPSEIAKLAMVVYFADWLSRRGDQARQRQLRPGSVRGDARHRLRAGDAGGRPGHHDGAGGDRRRGLLHRRREPAAYRRRGGGGGRGVLGDGQDRAPTARSRIAAWLDPFAHYQDAGWQPVHGAVCARQRRAVRRRAGAGAPEVSVAARRPTPTRSSR